MKKKCIAIALSVGVVLISLCTSCGNKTILDTVYTYDYAIIKLKNGEIVEGEVESWSDYEDGDQLQITIDGVTYLEHASSVDLISKKK